MKPESHRAVREAHHALVVDRQSSGVALAIASLASSVVEAREDGSVNGGVVFRQGTNPMLGGAIYGGLLGAFSGPEGAAIGAVIGGLVGMVAAACDEESDDDE
jgi:hypothetical protein